MLLVEWQGSGAHEEPVALARSIADRLGIEWGGGMLVCPLIDDADRLREPSRNNGSSRRSGGTVLRLSRTSTTTRPTSGAQQRLLFSMPGKSRSDMRLVGASGTLSNPTISGRQVDAEMVEDSSSSASISDWLSASSKVVPAATFSHRARDLISPSDFPRKFLSAASEAGP